MQPDRAQRGWPGWREAGAAFGLGLIVALGQVPFSLPYVAVPALALFLWRLGRTGATLRRGFWLGLFLGAGHFGLALSWIVQPFLVDPVRHGWMAPFALMLMAFGMGLFWAAAVALGQVFARPLLATLVLLAAVEALRGLVLTGFPWAMIGHVLLGTPLEQLAALSGALGMTVFVLAVAGLLLARWSGIALAGVLVAGAYLWGDARLERSVGPGPGGVVRLVQPNIEQALKWEAGAAEASFRRLIDLTLAPPKGGGRVPDLVIWPETAVPYLMTEGEGAAAAIGDLGVPVLAGFQRAQGDAAWNSMAVIGPGGRMSQIYDKVHLVPFGEYMPLGDLAYRWFGIAAFAAQTGQGYSAGDAPRLLDLGPGLGRVRPLICYEAIFAEEIAAGPRPDWLLLITNDAWFGTLTGPYQHLSLARLRAIEQGVPLIRVANTGISAVIAANGKVVANSEGLALTLPLGVDGVIDAAVPGVLPPTAYSRSGDWPVYGILALGLLAARWRHRGVKTA